MDVVQASIANTNHLLGSQLGARLEVARTQNLLQRILGTTSTRRTLTCRKAPAGRGRLPMLLNTCVAEHAVDMFDGEGRATERRRHQSHMDVHPATLQMNFAIDMGYAVGIDIADEPTADTAISADTPAGAAEGFDKLVGILTEGLYLDAWFPPPGIVEHLAGADKELQAEYRSLLNHVFPAVPIVELSPPSPRPPSTCGAPRTGKCATATGGNPPEHMVWAM